MSFDLAIDYNTGDLIMAPNHDLQGRSGPDVYEQRIRIRLKIQRGTWALDPTDGALGSRLLELARMRSARAVEEVQQYALEALEPMRDIVVRDVKVNISPETEKNIEFSVFYQPVTDAEGDDTIQSISMTIST